MVQDGKMVLEEMVQDGKMVYLKKWSMQKNGVKVNTLPTGACFTLLTIVSPYWHLFTPTDACFPLLALVSRTDTCFPH